ncbi:hypothetical protein BCR35DRAFT_300227, partial [Leucosporidium creatinivorum]
IPFEGLWLFVQQSLAIQAAVMASVGPLNARAAVHRPRSAPSCMNETGPNRSSSSESRKLIPMSIQ